MLHSQTPRLSAVPVGSLLAVRLTVIKEHTGRRTGRYVRRLRALIGRISSPVGLPLQCCRLLRSLLGCRRYLRSWLDSAVYLLPLPKPSRSHQAVPCRRPRTTLPSRATPCGASPTPTAATSTMGAMSKRSFDSTAAPRSRSAKPYTCPETGSARAV